VGAAEEENKSPAEEDDKKLAGQVWLSYPSFHLHCLIDLAPKKITLMERSLLFPNASGVLCIFLCMN
jgi:hypothetical protein